MLSQKLRQRILDFRDERDWKQFDNLRTLSTSIVLEAAELAEQPQWIKDAELDDLIRAKRAKIEQEVAGIVILLTYLTADLDIDVDRAVQEKLEINAGRYPIERVKGSARKYDELELSVINK